MSKYSGIAHYQDFNELVKLLGQSNSTYDIDKITKAYKFAEKAHGDQRRVSGIPYILHPTSVACILAELGMDTDAICAALLHDVVEDTPTTLEEVEKLFGADVARLIDGVTKISKIAFSSREQRQAENIRKMLIAMANDIRVIIIKLADRLHNMRTISCMPEQSRRDKAHENMQVYAPIAHRLGIKTIKDELEDLSLQYLDPIGYKEIEDAISLSENDRDKFIESIKNQILEKTNNIIKNVYISGRVKSVYSIYRKTFMQGKTIDQIFDVFAVRVIVDTVSDCYNVLGVVHDIFKPIPNRFKDYISMPKPNMYQSLHTTVLDKRAIPFEVQIRTWEMHYTAEYGIAAHWKYKLGMGAGGKGESTRLAENIEKVKNMILDQLEAEDVTDIAKNIRNDFEEN
ncbi:MAG TPA: (p)ppGpp synthetase, partial [Ruminococcaceae bacterium]|nr:(p)ppGpp synthetase [Oscillospiraceae bacterium]